MGTERVAHFLERLFIELERHEVRYCVLHSYEDLPDELPSDLDMALHPADAPKLCHVFRALRQSGYDPLQCISYSAGSRGSHYFIFGWFDKGEFFSAAIDFTCQHREGGIILLGGEELVRARRKRGLFWIADPATEFEYILGKKILKGTVNTGQANRLAALAEEIGRQDAERAARRLVGEADKVRLVDACLNYTLEKEVSVFRRKAVLAAWKRNPLRQLSYLATEAHRFYTRVRKPTGMVVAMLGPDGVGKSSLLPHVIERMGGCFRRHRVFHWRPQVLWNGRSGPVEDPHARTTYTSVRSTIHLLGHALDFTLGYWFRVYPAKLQTGLVLFDRYFDDLMIDPVRYRYGGPLWLVRLLGHIVPKPELFLILDAPTDAILARKQELRREDVVRLTHAYRCLSYQFNSARLIDATGSPEAVTERAVRALGDYLAARFERNYGRYQPDQSCAQLHEAMKWLASASEQPEGFRKGAGGTTRVFAVVPSKREPRWIIPLQQGRSALSALQMITPYTGRARAFKSLVSLSMKLPLPAAVPGDVISLFNKGASPLETLVAEKLGERDAVFGVSFGTSGRHRKLTIQVMNTNGTILAYIKIPMTAIGNERVRHEASILERLTDYPDLRKHIPQSLFAGEWENRHILIETALRGSRGPTKLTRVYTKFLQTLWAAQPTYRSGEEIVAEVSCDWHSVRERLDLRWKQIAEEVLDTANRRISGTRVPCGLSHGDFAPWNTRTENGILRVFDWECAGWSQPIWWDIFHFETQSSTLLKRFTPKMLRGDSRTIQATYMLYLLSSTCRLLRDEPTEMRGLDYRRERLAAELIRPASVQAYETLPYQMQGNT